MVAPLLFSIFGEVSQRWGSAAEATATAAAAQKQDDPDKITSAAAATATSTAASAAVMVEASAASATAAQNQDKPDNIAPAASCSTSTSTVTTAVCCCYITHVSSSKLSLITLYHMTPCLIMFPGFAIIFIKIKWYNQAIYSIIVTVMYQHERKEAWNGNGQRQIILSDSLCEVVYVYRRAV